MQVDREIVRRGITGSAAPVGVALPLYVPPTAGRHRDDEHQRAYRVRRNIHATVDASQSRRAACFRQSGAARNPATRDATPWPGRRRGTIVIAAPALPPSARPSSTRSMVPRGHRSVSQVCSLGTIARHASSREAACAQTAALRLRSVPCGGCEPSRHGRGRGRGWCGGRRRAVPCLELVALLALRRRRTASDDRQDRIGRDGNGRRHGGRGWWLHLLGEAEPLVG